MIKCTKCNKIKPDNDFAWRNEAKGIRSSECKTCHNKYNKQFYKDNMISEIKRVRERVRRNREWYRKYKTTLKCNRCPEKDAVCLDFHHEGFTDKEDGVANLINRGWSIKRILKEIEKCEVLCSNCHRKEHEKTHR